MLADFLTERKSRGADLAACTHCYDCFDPAVDAVVPSVTAFAQQQRLAFWGRPILARGDLLTWRGESARSKTGKVAAAYARQASSLSPDCT